MAPAFSTNRFAALMSEAQNPTVVNTPTPIIPPPVVTPLATTQTMDDDDDETPWLLAPVTRNASNRKKGKSTSQRLQKTPAAVQVPKTLPTQVHNPAVPNPEALFKFAMDCRIKVLAHESVNPARLVQAMLTIFQHADPRTVLTTSLYNIQDGPMIKDPTTVPKTEAKLAPFVSSWKKLRDDLFLCRIHLVSESPFEFFKKESKVMDFLKKEDIIIERAMLDSSDHQLVGFLANVVPDQDSLSAQQYRFEKLLKEVPGFQLVTRKLTLKENSKLWSTVLKIRVDRADADELTLAFQQASIENKDFQYYAFDQFTSLHLDQKRYIIETQRNFVLQNRSVVIEWMLKDIPNFVMWMDDDDYNSDWEEEEREVEMNITDTPKRVNKANLQMNQNSISSKQSKRTHDDSVQTDQEQGTQGTTSGPKRRTHDPKIVNNVDLRKVGIDDFLYSYKAGDGSPLIRYIYPEADGRRELLVSRSKRAEVNSFIKVIYRELIRYMSVTSRTLAFENHDELYQEAMLASPWSPSGLHTMVPFSTTASNRSASHTSGTKRRNTNSSAATAASSHTSLAAPTTTISTTMDVGTSSSSLTDRSTTGSSISTTGHNINVIHQQEELNLVKAQLGILQQQHTNLFQTVKQMSQQHISDKQELKHAITENQTNLQSYVSTALSNNASHITETLQSQYMESINQLRQETHAMDQRQTAAHNQFKSDMSSEVSAAITALTSVVAKMELGQANFINQLSASKEQEHNVQKDQIALFLNNITATGMEVDVCSNQDPKASSQTVSENVNPPAQNTMSSLPSTIGKVALTTLQGLNKRGGRGGGRELRQQTLTTSTKSACSATLEGSTPPQNILSPTSNTATPSTRTPFEASTMHKEQGSTGNRHT